MVGSVEPRGAVEFEHEQRATATCWIRGNKQAYNPLIILVRTGKKLLQVIALRLLYRQQDM